MKQPAAQPTKSPAPQAEKQFVFDGKNYKLMLIGLGLLALGYILMVGGGTTDPNEFADSLFSFQRITLAPLLIIAGFVVEIFAIMAKPKKPEGKE